MTTTRRDFLKQIGLSAAAPLLVSDGVHASSWSGSAQQISSSDATEWGKWTELKPSQHYIMHQRYLADVQGNTVWIPMVVAAAPVPPAPIVLPPPPGINISATNSQVYRDRAGVIFAATRAGSDIGGLVWRVDGYIDADHPGTATYVLNDPFNPEPTKFHANGELEVWADGYLYYTTITIQDLDHRTALNLISYPVPGWTP